MMKPWIVIAVLLAILPAFLEAQGGRGGRKGGKGGNDRGNDNGGTTETKPAKPADLSAGTITAKWKDSKTLEISATVKNASPDAFFGSRTATIKITGKDGKTEVVKEETLPGLAEKETHTITVALTDKKYFDKDLKWTIEISAGDSNAGNDKKTTTLTPGPPPKVA